MTAPDASSWGPLIVQTLVATLLSGSIVGLGLKALVDRHFERMRLARDWQEKSLSLLIGPVVMHLARTQATAERYQRTFNARTKSYFDAQLMRDSNLELRAVLLKNGHLLPQALLGHAHSLVAHYDVWLARFGELEALQKPTAESTFDIGFVEVPFPHEASVAFLEVFADLRQQLYGTQN